MNPNADDRISAVLQTMSKDELIALMDRIAAENLGISLDAYQRHQQLNASLQEEGENYRGRPVSEWPPLRFNWDLSLDGQCYGLDGVSKDQFQEIYPNGLLLGETALATFDSNLAHFSRRDTPEELWELGSEFKLAKNIAYIHRGLPITPPVVGLSDGQFILRGGHHRYAIAKAVNLELIPFLLKPDDAAFIADLVQVHWMTPTQVV